MSIRFQPIVHSVAILLMVVSSGLHTTATQGPSRAPGSAPALTAVDDPLDAYLLGVWHLALAIGRATCQHGQLTAEFRTLIARDVNWVERAMQAEATCASPRRFAVSQPVDLEAANIEDLRHRLQALRSDFEQLAGSSACWSQPPQVSRLRSLAEPVFAVGEAAAATICAIATWQHALPADAARAVARDVEGARTMAARIQDESLRAAFLADLDRVRSQIVTVPGETIYHALVATMNRVQAALRRSP